MTNKEIMTNKEAIEQLKWVQKRICEITYSPESFEAINLAIKALEERQQEDIIQEIPKDFVYDTETSEFYCYRNKYTGEEIHIIKSPKTYMLERPQGEWRYGEDESGQDGWFCSECGFFVPWYYTYYENDVDFIREYKVCPHCLAEMVTYTGKDRDVKGGKE